MKKIAVYLVVIVLFLLGGCDYFPDRTIEYPVDHFDKASCLTVDRGLTTGKTLYASTDPYFLDDNNINALMRDADGIREITTKVNVLLATGEKNSAVSTVAFATIENYHDSVSVVELYLHKDEATVSSLISGQSFDKVVLTDNFETAMSAEFDSVHTQGSEQEFTIVDEMTNYDFFIEATRCLYGENGNIPVITPGERSTLVTCAAVEVMSLYSYFEIEEADVYSFYFDDYISMRIWDSTGTRVPVTDVGIPLEMAAAYSGRSDKSKGTVLGRSVYDLEPGRYLVRWIRAESTKSANNPESESNYYNFRVGIFPESYQEDSEIAEIAENLLNPSVTLTTKSVFQCDTSLWKENDALAVGDLLRSADKMNALLDGLDSVTVEDLDKGIFLEYDQDLPQGLFFLKLDSLDADTLRIYTTGGSFVIYQRTAVMSTGGMRFGNFNPNLSGITFKEMFVSDKIDDVRYFYNFVPSLYIVALSYDGEEDGVNIVIKGN